MIEVANILMPLLSIVLITVLAVLGFFLKAELNGLKEVKSDVKDLHAFAAEVRANRVSAEDIKELWKEIASIRQYIAELPKESPPAWFMSRVEKLDVSVALRITALEVQVQQLTVEVAKLGKG